MALGRNAWPTAAILVIAAVTFSAPAAQAETDADVERLVAVLAGEYDSAPLVAAARARAVQGARLPRELAEAHYMFATPVDMPRLGRHVVYIEWRHDRRDGPISGQRVWAFDARDDGIVMRFFTLKPAAKAALDGLIAPDPKTAALGPDDLNGYPPPCHIVLKRSGDVFEGANAPPGGCVFPRTTVTGGTMRADAFIRFALELHREKVDMVQTGPGEALSDHAAETEDWIYLRVK